MRALLKKDVDFGVLSNKENEQIATSLLNLEKVVLENILFNIPIYQRLYVWKTDQIKTLLEDLKTAFESKEESYFLGGIMLSSSEKGKIDLVDGQQRFTTLWLICDILSDKVSSLRLFTYHKNEPRIHFSIRDKAQEYLKDHSSFNKYFKEDGEIMNVLEAEISEIIPLATARKTIIGLLEEFEKKNSFEINDFGEFLFKKVFLSQTFIPIKSDMNRVFEAMNNRGKQLAHHELLKSKLLAQIPNTKRLSYALIWDACSDMNNYIEKSTKDVAGLYWKDLFSNFDFLHEEGGINKQASKYSLDALDIVKLLNEKNQDKESKKFLIDILKNQSENSTSASGNQEIKESEYSSKKIRSIISFPVFLLHTLRVFQANEFGVDCKSSDVNDKKLIEHFQGDIFFSPNKQLNEKNVIKFIKLLWDLRIMFDRYVIKWVYDDENKEEYHNIQKMQISKSKRDGSISGENISIQRIDNTDETVTDLIVLQGMLYHSQEMITQYWLTPFLYFLSKNKFKSDEEVLNKLEIIDNELFYSNYSDNLKDRTYSIIFKTDLELQKKLFNSKTILEQAKGTSYANYIFYKLEYILWKNRKTLCNKHSLDCSKWSSYRMTAKNSVEHVFPRNAREENNHIEYLDQKGFEDLENQEINPLDEFGNLVLISPGMNSEYSNKSYKEKKGKFDAKKDLDSLKSALIFKHDNWNYDLAVQHRNEMIELIDSYVNANISRT